MFDVFVPLQAFGQSLRVSKGHTPICVLCNGGSGMVEGSCDGHAHIHAPTVLRYLLAVTFLDVSAKNQ
jgi:hypothetical protein